MTGASSSLTPALMDPEDWVNTVDSVDPSSAALDRLHDFYRRVRAIAADPESTLAELRLEFEHWGDAGAEPDDVDYVHNVLGSVPSLRAIPHGADEDRVLVCLHGGAYVCGSFFSHRKMYAHLAKRTGCIAEIVGYGLVPDVEHPTPALDVLQAYRFLLEDRGIAPERIGVVGDSAGAALCVSSVLLARAEDRPMPAAIAPLSPWVELEALDPIYDTNDRDLIATREQVLISTDSFIGNGDPKDPLAAPIYADFEGFPPIYMQARGAENFAADARFMGTRASEHGVDVRLDIFDDMQHVFQMAVGAAPEANEAVDRLAKFFREHIGLEAESPKRW